MIAKDNKINNKVEDKMMEKLNELTNQFFEMKMNMVGNLNKRPKPISTRTNGRPWNLLILEPMEGHIWCLNCQGHGRMKS